MMTIDAVAGADIAATAIDMTTAVVAGTVGTGANMNGMVAATTIISAATAQATPDTSGTIPTDTGIGSLYLSAA
jgi:hypothetical protein